MSGANQPQNWFLGFLKRHPRTCKLFLPLIKNIYENHYSLLLNFCVFSYIRWSHSFSKLVIIVLNHANSRLFPKFFVILCIQIIFVGWVLGDISTRLYDLHLKIGRNEPKIRALVAKCNLLLQDRRELLNAPISIEKIQNINLKLNFLQKHFEKHVRVGSVNEYLFLRSQIPFLLKSMMSMVIFLIISRFIVCYLIFELLLTFLFIYFTFLLNKNAYLITLFQISTSFWYFCLLLIVFLTTHNDNLEPQKQALTVNVMIVKYYICFFMLYVVRMKYKTCLRLPKFENNLNKKDQIS